MHGYYWDKKRLERTLEEFVGGQFLMETTDDLIFRGEIKSFSIPKNGDKRILISFDWLSECRPAVDASFNRIPKWFLVEQSIESPLDVSFSSYYSQPDEGRVKMWGVRGEICHFFRKEDHTNLVRQGDEFVPYCQLRKFELRRLVVAMLLSPKWQ